MEDGGATTSARTRADLLFAAGIAAAALIYDPAAAARAPKTTVLLVVALGALGAALPRLQRQRGHGRSAVPAAVGAWLLWCGYGALSTTWADHHGPHPLGGWVAAGALALALSGLEVERLRRIGGWAAGLAGATASVVCLAQAASASDAMARHGLQGNPNWLGLVLACGLPLQIDQAVVARRASQAHWRAMALAAGLSMVALVLAASRVSWAAALVAGAVFAAGRWRHGLVAASALGLLGALSSTALAESWGGRVWIWRVSAQIASDELPLGCGLGAFGERFLSFQGQALAAMPPNDGATRFVNATTAHNDWLEALATGGPLGALCLGLALGSAAWLLRTRWRGGAAAALTVALCALGDSPLHQPAVLALLAPVLAATPALRLGRWFMLVHATTFAGVILLMPRATATWLGQRSLAHARQAPQQARLVALERAVQIDPRSGEAELLAGLGYLEIGDAGRAVPHLRRSRRLLANLGTDVALGNARLALDEPERAVAAYRRAIARHPGYFRAHANLVEALRLSGQLDQAERHLEVARQLQPGHPKLARMAERLRRSRIDADTRR